MSLLEHRFSDAGTCANALAAHIGELVRAAITHSGEASLIVSGGKSPQAFFERIREFDIDWPHVSLSLADERWVALSSPDSNEAFVRQHLLQGPAAAAHFTGLKNAAPSALEGAATGWAGVARLRAPFDAVMLGMGDDGHTASLFPGSPNLSGALDERAPPACVAMSSPVPPTDRLSLNLAALLRSRLIVLLITGEKKWRVYQRALQKGPALDMPVRAVLRQEEVPVEVYWSP